MEWILMLILNAVWMLMCLFCIVTGIILGTKKQKEAEPKPISEAEKRKIEKERRELNNFMSYTGDTQSP